MELSDLILPIVLISILLILAAAALYLYDKAGSQEVIYSNVTQRPHVSEAIVWDHNESRERNR